MKRTGDRRSHAPPTDREVAFSARRILDAVYQQLREAPSEPVSIDRIARMARVARPTVYLVFGSRAGLFDAVGADLLQRGGFDRVLQASAHPDAREALRGAIHAIVEMPRTRPG